MSPLTGGVVLRTGHEAAPLGTLAAAAAGVPAAVGAASLVPGSWNTAATKGRQQSQQSQQPPSDLLQQILVRHTCAACFATAHALTPSPPHFVSHPACPWGTRSTSGPPHKRCRACTGRSREGELTDDRVTAASRPGCKTLGRASRGARDTSKALVWWMLHALHRLTFQPLCVLSWTEWSPMAPLRVALAAQEDHHRVHQRLTTATSVPEEEEEAGTRRTTTTIATTMPINNTTTMAQGTAGPM